MVKQSQSKAGQKNESDSQQQLAQQLKRIPVLVALGMGVIFLLSIPLFYATRSEWIIWFCLGLFVVSLFPVLYFLFKPVSTDLD